jgi:hypothetical protein
MAGDTDFVALYQELGLSANCTLEEFKQAYRKRVGVLHPDRQPPSTQSTQGLQRLNTWYAAAMEFQRRHGRLPGATHAAPVRMTSREPVGSATRAPIPVEPARRSSLRPVLIILFIVLAGIWMASEFLPVGIDAPAVNMQPRESHLESPPDKTPAAAHAIELGASAQQVRAIHGEPVSGSEQRWEYGPSWIAFRCGQVVDWYSSPLRPLKVATAHPSASPQWSPPRNCKE